MIWQVNCRKNGRFFHREDLAFSSKEAAEYWVKMQGVEDHQYEIVRVSVYDLDTLKSLWA